MQSFKQKVWVVHFIDLTSLDLIKDRGQSGLCFGSEAFLQAKIIVKYSCIQVYNDLVNLWFCIQIVMIFSNLLLEIIVYY